jgi:hypothetical protein
MRILSTGAAILLGGAIVGTLLTDDAPRAVAGLDVPHACTEIGCDSGVGVRTTPIRHQLPDADHFEVCLNRKCRTFSPETDFAFVRNRSIHREKRVTVRLRVFDENGERLASMRRKVRLHRFRPNGPDCPPTCFGSSLKVDRKALRLRHRRR